MSNIGENVELLIHKLREMVRQKKEEESIKNDLIIQLEEQVNIITKRHSSEFASAYNIGSMNYLFWINLFIRRQEHRGWIYVNSNLWIWMKQHHTHSNLLDTKVMFLIYQKVCCTSKLIINRILIITFHQYS